MSTRFKNALTFDEWFERGYRIKKGEKSKSRNSLGQATFTLKQVWEVPESKRNVFLVKPNNSPPPEILKTIDEKRKVEEARHFHIDTSFDPTKTIFSAEDEPPY